MYDHSLVGEISLQASTNGNCQFIVDAVQKEVTYCDTCQRTKRSNKKYGKFPSKLA